MQIGDVWDTEDVILLSADGNITFLPAGHIIAASVSLTSVGGDILGSNSAVADVDTSLAGGPIVLTGQDIGVSGTTVAIDPGAGAVAVNSTGDVFLDVTAGNFAFSRFSALNVGSVAAAHSTLAC